MTTTPDELISTQAAFTDLLLTQIHEAGHAVAYYVYGFRPRMIKGALSTHDRRTTPFFRQQNQFSSTPASKKNLESYAVCSIAGIAAESKDSGIGLAQLRLTSGLEDYEAVTAIAERISFCHHPFEGCPEVSHAYIALWEARAVALFNHPQVWAGVESLANDLCNQAGEMWGPDISESIKRGMDEFHGRE